MTVITNNYIPCKVRTIRNDLIGLKEKYSYKLIDYPYTAAFKQQVYNEFYEWVNYWNLEGFRFKLLFEDNQIIFEPIRDIDKYVVIGIMNQ